MKPRRPFARLFYALPLLSLLLCHPSASRGESAFCATGKPESVLGCISAAFVARDIDAFGRLLASDFTFRTERRGKNDPAGQWNRDRQLEGTTSLFADKEVQAIRHTIKSYKSPKATGPNTWVITGIVTDVSVIQLTHPDQPLDAHTAGTTLRVRRVAQPVPHFEVFEWVERSK